jgi:hypothetical protein
MSYRKGIIPAYTLRSQSKGDGFIVDYVNSNLGLIEDDIIQANERKELFATTELPTNYDIPNMENYRAQRFVYYHTLQALKKAEYIGKIEFVGHDHNQKVFIHTRWVTKDDIDEEKYMDEFIMAHSTQSRRPDARVPVRVNSANRIVPAPVPEPQKRARRRRPQT